MTHTTSEVLNLAADAIERRGWTQGTPDNDPWGQDGTSPVCIEGGIMAALGIGWSHDVPACRAYQAVATYLTDGDLPHGRWRLYEWNDDADRTQAEVIEVLRAAAVIEQARENADVAEPVTA